VSWGELEHQYYLAGDNQLTMVLLPDQDQYQMIVGLASHDAFS